MVVNFSLNKQSIRPNLRDSSKKDLKRPSFNGLGEFVTKALIASDKSPMIGVSIIDLCSMICPRTVVDATRNGFAATETFLRESAGLIINCLIPSFVVYGVAKLIEKPVMGKDFSGIEASTFWANQNSNEFLTKVWKNSQGEGKERVRAFVENVLDNIEGLQGTKWNKIAALADKKAIYDNLANAIASNDKELLGKTTDLLISKLGASRNIRLVSENVPDALKGTTLDFGLKNLTRDMKDMGGAFLKMSDDALPTFSKKLTKLINRKSALGLAVIVAAGASFQYFNRMLTKYRTGNDGFVGEADYIQQLKEGKKIDKKEFCEHERRKLNLHKLLGTLGMGLLAVLSFGKIPTRAMFQFNGMFPTLNQCRAISAVTYSGRIISSANDNELKESALRDTCTFVNLYYLGDYVSKAFATIKEKVNPELTGKLLNHTKQLPENANAFTKFWYWFRHTEIKGFEELVNNPAVKRNRAYSQASGLLYSCIVLGLLVPLYNKHRTQKKGKARLQAAEIQNKSNEADKLYQKKVFTAFIRDSKKA